EREAARAREATVLALAAHDPAAAAPLAPMIEDMALPAEDLAPARQAVLDLLYAEADALPDEVAALLAAVGPARGRLAALRRHDGEAIAAEIAETVERPAAALARAFALAAPADALGEAVAAGDLDDAAPLEAEALERHRALARPAHRRFAEAVAAYCTVADRRLGEEAGEARAGLVDDEETARLLREAGYEAKKA
ncbi:MAG: hypothetical protein ACFBWO_17925, partial [Paracoccaceae bacterium]